MKKINNYCQLSKKYISIFIFGLLVFANFSFISPVQSAAKNIVIPEKEFKNSFTINKSEYISSVEKNDFAFTGVASQWSKDIDDPKIYWRMGKTDSSLGDWLQVVLEEDGKTSTLNSGEIINSDKDLFFQYKIDFKPQDFGRNFEIKFNLFDTSNSTGSISISADNSGLGPKIISRSEWGANESYMKWIPEYGEVKAFVIHHTAGEEGAKLENQASVVRNLYYGHAVSYGWGDIGYNYVIDVNGNIYEGRSGGGAVVGGHTLGYNMGTIGIVLIGDYNVRNVENSQMEALANLIAYKSFQYGLNPTGQVYLKDKTINTVVGHRDLNATLCPGTTIYGRILDIANKAKEKLNNYPVKINGVQFISADSNTRIYGGDISKIKVSFKNTGNVPLLSEGNGRFNITTSGKLASNLSNFGRSIEPGEIGNFNLEITAPAVNENISQIFEPRIGGNLVSGAGFNLSLNVLTPEYRGKIIGKSADQSLVAGKQATLWVDIKNVGSKTWTNNDGIKLVTASSGNDLFYTNGDWENNKVIGTFDSLPVSPGNIGRITFLITAPSNAGQYKELFNLHSDICNIEGGDAIGLSWNITVTASSGQLTNTNPAEPKVYSSNINDYSFSLINQSPYLTMNPGEKKGVSLEIKNTGKSNWYRDVFHLATIGDKESSFSDSSWASKNRIAFAQDKVAPGENAIFNFTVTAPSAAGLTKERFGLVVEGVGWMKDIGLFWNFTVNQIVNSNNNSGISQNGIDDFTYVNQSPYLTMNAGESQQVWLEVKNTGSKIWQKSGTNPVRLATSNPRDRISSFINSNRVLMDRDTVNPGENVRFTFNITAPSEAKVYKEYFTLVRDGVAWFKDIGIYWQITVNPINNQGNNNSGNLGSNVDVSVSQKVTVSANGPYIVVNSAESKLAEGGNGDTITAFYKDGKNYFSINGGQLKEASGWTRIVPWAPQTILTITSYSDRPSWNQSLNDNKFKGAIEVRYSAKNKKLWVIDDVNIEDYLAGVSEPLEAGPYEYIKAAVIAERSYVYYHLQRGGRWPDDFITLKNSRNGNGDDQIYQGYGFSIRATNIPRAVSETAGQVVTYNGKPVLTPYYTQSDGRTRSISEVWGSNQADYPWLVSVADPWCSGSQMLGHGVGMSGKGARGMASEGKKYDEILKYFYTGTSIGKIDTNRNVRIGIYYISL